MTWKGAARLGDFLAIAAGEFLPDMLDHLPAAGDRLQSFGDGLAQLGQAGAAAASAGGRPRHDDALARQVFREGLTRWSIAGERGDIGGFGSGYFCRQLVLSGAHFQVFEFQRHLVEQARGALRAWAEFIALQLLDLQFQMRDEGMVVGPFRLLIGEFSRNAGVGHIGGLRPRVLLEQCRFERANVVRQGREINHHAKDRITKATILAMLFCDRPEIFSDLSGRLRPPAMLRVAPVDRLQQITHLRRGQ